MYNCMCIAILTLQLSRYYFTQKSFWSLLALLGNTRNVLHHISMLPLHARTEQIMRVSLDSTGSGYEGCHLTTIEGLRSQPGIEGPISSVSSWLSSSLEYSTSTIKYLSGWGPSASEELPSTASVNDDDISWRNVTTVPTTPKGSAMRKRHYVAEGSPISVRNTVDRTERAQSYKNIQTSHQAAKDRLAKAVADARKCKREARLLQHRVLAYSSPVASGTTSISTPLNDSLDANITTRGDTKQKTRDTPKHLPSAFKFKRTGNGVRVHFDPFQNRIIDIPRVNPADKPRLFYRQKEFRIFNRNELNLFHAYHFYEDMYTRETSFATKEALRRRMSSIANLMPNDKTTKTKRSPAKKRKRSMQAKPVKGG